jgi:gliding motility-associated-like protein
LDKDEIPHLDEGIANIQIMVQDKAGNLGISNPVNIRVDRSISAPVIVSLTHPDQNKWYNDKNISLSWNVTDSYSGLDGYSWLLDNSENTVPKDAKITEETHFERELPDGLWYFHIRAVDNAGNWSETTHYRVKIDTTPPTAQLKISGTAVIAGNPPIARSGTLEVLLKASEPIFNPILQYKPVSAITPIPVNLTGSGTEWKGFFNVDLRTGDGNAVFIFSALDEAQNMGDIITEGDYFRVDTLIHANENGEILCITEPGTRISVPSGTNDQDMRIEIIKTTPDSGAVASYNIIAYDVQMRKLSNLRLRRPLEITFDSKYNDLGLSVYFWDEVKWHKVQDSLTGVKIDYLGKFALMKPSIAERNVEKCWAAPNPFTPNGSNDPSDKTIFHVVTGDSETEFTINVYDINGRLVKRIENNNRVWNGTDDRGKPVEGGLYIFQVHLGHKIMSGTVVVLR